MPQTVSVLSGIITATCYVAEPCDNHNVKHYEYRLIVNLSYPENRSELVYSSAISKIFHSMADAIEWVVQRAT